MYSKKSYSGGRTVKVTDSPNQKNWNSCEYPKNYKPINPNADDKVKNAIKISNTYKLRVTKKGVTKKGVTKKGPRYAVAVGPVVLCKEFSKNNTPSNFKKLNSGGHFASHYGIELDAEIKKSGKKYYVRCVAGDLKAHTYPNGIYQTGISYENINKQEPNTDNSVIEFIGKVLYKNAELNTYKISKVIVYDNKKIG